MSNAIDTTKKATKNYIDKAQLALLVRRAQATGQADPEYCDVARRIGEGVAVRFFFSKQADIEEAGTIGVITALKVIDKIKPAHNVFCYLTTCIRRAISKECVKVERDAARLEKYREKRMSEKAQAEEAEREAERATDELLRRLSG